MPEIKGHLSLLSTSAIVAILVIISCDSSNAYSNRLLRFARNDPKWRLPKWQNLLDLLTFKRSGGDVSPSEDVTDEEVSTIIDEALQRPFIKRGSMRLRRLRRADRLQSLKRSDRLQRLRREDGDTPEGAPEVDMNMHPAITWRHGQGMME